MTDNNTMFDKRDDSVLRNGTVARFFSDWNSASRAVDSLRAAGFQDGQIGILARDPKKSSASAATRGDKTTDGDDVASSAVAGAAVGGVTGLLAALVALAIPGAGPFIAGGVLATTLGSAAAGSGIGAVAGGLIGALTNMGVSEADARYYDEGIRSGGTLVTVHDTERATEAAQILEQHGGRQRS